MATESNQSDFVHTNFRVFYKIAKEAYEAMRNDLDSSRRPRPGGEPGWIITYDPDKKSFKNAFITIVFCGVQIEAVLHLLIVKYKGVEVFKKYDAKSYEDKLKLLGCTDKLIMELCERFRKTRREIVHEKAYLNAESFRIAQKEAETAIELVDKIIAYFKLEFNQGNGGHIICFSEPARTIS